MGAREWITGTAVAGTGLYAGVYVAFAVGVMPGLARTSDAAYVEAMQEINRAIVNPAFMALFLGAPALTIGALIVAEDAARPWLLAALGLHAATFLITVAANVPLNDTLDAASRSAASSARDAFSGQWVAWNVARSVTSVAALGALVRSLL